MERIPQQKPMSQKNRRKWLEIISKCMEVVEKDDSAAVSDDRF